MFVVMQKQHLLQLGPMLVSSSPVVLKLLCAGIPGTLQVGGYAVINALAGASGLVLGLGGCIRCLVYLLTGNLCEALRRREYQVSTFPMLTNKTL